MIRRRFKEASKSMRNTDRGNSHARWGTGMDFYKHHRATNERTAPATVSEKMLRPVCQQNFKTARD